MFATNKKNSLAYSAFSLKMTTINLCNFIAPPGSFYSATNKYSQEQWMQKKAWLNQYIGCYQPDIIAFQEVFSSSELKTLLEPLGYRFFSVVDEPETMKDSIYKKPVVCLASRYPILRAGALAPDPKLTKKLGMTKGFKYSRTPLFATLELPYLGECDFYIVHLKSKRPITDLDDLNKVETLHDSMQTEITGTWAASVQRGSEACQLMASIIERRSHKNNPAIVMGDFNDELGSDILRSFHISRLRSITEDMADMPLSHYQLHDSWDLFLNNTDEMKEKRKSTHYFHKKGMVLDYILLSNEFNSRDPEKIAEVIGFHCEDAHLYDQNQNELSSTSDHAFITITLSLPEC